MFRNDIDAAMERARIAEEELRRLEAKDEQNQEEIDDLRATLEAQQAEIAKLRKLAPAPKPVLTAPTGFRLATIIVTSVTIIAAGAVGLLLLRGGSPEKPPVVTSASADERALAEYRRKLRLASSADEAPASESSPLGEEIGDQAMAALLRAARWRTDWLKGELRFADGAHGLEGLLVAGAGSERKVKVELGKLATLTLRVSSEASGMTERLTFFGAVNRDRKSIRGTVDRVLVEGANEHAEQGVFTLTAVR